MYKHSLSTSIDPFSKQVFDSIQDSIIFERKLIIFIEFKLFGKSGLWVTTDLALLSIVFKTTAFRQACPSVNPLFMSFRKDTAKFETLPVSTLFFLEKDEVGRDMLELRGYFALFTLYNDVVKLSMDETDRLVSKFTQSKW